MKRVYVGCAKSVCSANRASLQPQFSRGQYTKKDLSSWGETIPTQTTLVQARRGVPQNTWIQGPSNQKKMNSGMN